MPSSTALQGWARRVARLVSTLALVAAGSGGADIGRAQSGPTLDRPDREGDVPLAALPLIGAALEAAQAAPALEGSQSTWGQVVFQSYRDGNWELYTGSDSFGSPRRLTASGASDVQPKISRDGRWIAFVSNRDGNYELYRTDLDGDPVVRLTNDAATDSNPSWSPDGSRLAFQSNRMGNYDVWVMNADGTGLQNLTGANPGYDGEPTWSPDGSRIAFVSRRGGQTNDYVIHVMDADGTDPQLLVDWPNSGRPAWSPDDRWIIFDGADSFDMQRIFMYEVATQQLYVHPVNGSTTDVEAGAWAVRDEFLVTRIDYVVEDGAWYIAALTPYLYRASSLSLAEQALGGPYDGWPSWFSLDSVPPVSQQPTVWNVYQRGTANRLFVFAADDRSEVGWYEVQRRAAPDGPWENVTAGGCDTLPSRVGRCTSSPAGAMTDYRVRAIDTMGNLEPWPTDPGRWVRVFNYTGVLTGTVTDVRGRPLAGVSIDASHVFEGARLTGDDGQARFHLADGGDFVITATIAGNAHVQMKATAGGNADEGYSIGFVLRDPTTHVTNGSFETGLDGWTNAGDGVVNVINAPGRDGAHFLALGTALSWLAQADSGPADAPLAESVSAISQTVTIPADLPEPTLSFAYQHYGGAATGVPLVLTLAEAGSAAPPTRWEYPTVFWGWSSIWIDLTPWLGKTVVLTFSAEQHPDAYYGEASTYELDDVAVGSAARPFVTAVSPSSAWPLEGLTVEGTGFTPDVVVWIGGVAAPTTYVDAQHLSATVPSNAAWGTQPLIVVDADGFADEAPGGLTVGFALRIPSLLRHFPGDVLQGWP